MSSGALHIPILRIGRCLVATIYVALDDSAIRQFQEDLLARISKEAISGVVIDLSAIDLVDSFMARSLEHIASAARLLGARVILVGIRPPVAITLVEMGLRVHSAETARDLEQGLRALVGEQLLEPVDDDTPEWSEDE
ncbi:MAG: STAS domain-containing protein [Myxococcales bacterium]|nr:STAS domain-containing protein [Myxococcales bacterium]